MNCQILTSLCFVILQITVEIKSRESPSKTWVLLVAGSNEWYNYRHQADICHAYQIVKSHGIPDENIIVMMYDDIAHNKENPHQGVIRNHPNGPNVYKNVPKDYVGKAVNSSNFLKILSGDAKGMKGIGSGKVIKSSKNDRIFVNFVDHGGSGILCFPSDQLTAKTFLNALKEMHTRQKYSEMVMYIEACESGSMFKDILPKNLNIFVTTASDFNEPSMACYLDDNMDTFLGDCYSVNWMEDTDKADISRETLLQQYIRVKNETTTSHVKQYGTLKIENEPVGDFQGEERTEIMTYPEVERMPTISHDVPLVLMKLKMAKNHQKQAKQLYGQYKSMKKARVNFEKSIRTLLKSMSNGSEQAERWFQEHPEKIADLDCHDYIVTKFSQDCLTYGKSPYALKFVYTLTNVCNDGVKLEKINSAIKKHCSIKPLFNDGVV